MIKFCKIKKFLRYYHKYGFKFVIKLWLEKTFKLEEKRYKVKYKKSILSEEEKRKQSEKIFPYMPQISIVVPLYKTPLIYLQSMINSVCKQTYQNWELCLSDGSGEKSTLKDNLKEYLQKDTRIKVVNDISELNISENTNKAIEICTGDYVAFLDHDDLLAPNALYECVKVINEKPNVKIIYTDEDKVSMNGKKYFQPHFKPDFNKDLLNSTNYFCHLLVVSKSILEQVGKFHPEFNGAQDYDFILRCTEISEDIYHIPKVLYHWRTHEGSTAEKPESKIYAFEAGAKAIRAHYERIGIKNARVKQTKYLGVYRTKYNLYEKPRVSIIIPNRDHINDLKRCLYSIKCSNYPELEIIIVENNSVKKDTFDFYKELEKEDEKIVVLYWKGKFNYSAINNYATSVATGEFVLFLNNDTEMINKSSIEELVAFCMRQDVGAVGARLYYYDNTIQHAGVVVGLGGIAGHIFLNTPREQAGYFARIVTQQNYSAVTGACIMVRKHIFDEVGGFDEKLAIAFNDVDLCLKVQALGRDNVWLHEAELYHFESQTRGYDDKGKKKKRFEQEKVMMEEKWGPLIENDPFYNPNLTRDIPNFSLRID